MAAPRTHPRLFDTTKIPCQYPRADGRVGATPTRWRYRDDELQPLLDFLADVNWAWQEDADLYPTQKLGPVRVLLDVARRWGLDVDAQRWPHPRYGQEQDNWRTRRMENVDWYKR